MKKKITITLDVEKLKMSEGKKTLINFRVEEGLYDRFKKLCEGRFGQGMSDILRKIMKELCENYGHKE